MFIGVIVLVLQGVISESDQLVIRTILGLVILLATSELIERQRKLSKIENAIYRKKQSMSNNLDNLIVDEMDVDELVEFMRYKTLTAKESILWASPEPRRGTSSDAIRSYEKAIDEVLKTGKIRFTWLSTMSGSARAKRAIRLLRKHSSNSNLYIGKIGEIKNNFPLFSFIIYDNKVLTIRAPYREGRKGRYFAITSPTVIEMFVDYFNRLLETADKLEPKEEIFKYLEKMINDSI